MSLYKYSTANCVLCKVEKPIRSMTIFKSEQKSKNGLSCVTCFIKEELHKYTEEGIIYKDFKG